MAAVGTHGERVVKLRASAQATGPDGYNKIQPTKYIYTP